MQVKEKNKKRERRSKRTRAKIKGTATCPRLSVFRSSKHITLQLIDDEKRKSLLQMGDSKLLARGKKTKIEKARLLGKKLAELAKSKKIKKVIFDRGGYKYHGRVKAAAEGMREGGLMF